MGFCRNHSGINWPFYPKVSHILWKLTNFIYTSKQLTRLEASNGSTTNTIKYNYTGDQVSRTEEFSANGKLINTITYQYSPDNRLRRLDQTRREGTEKVETAQLFTYDNTGNLTQLVDAAKDTRTGTYRVELVTRYTGYDLHKNVTHLWTVYPFLPNVTFQINNPTVIVQYIEEPDGTETLLHRSDYSYRYNDRGYPVSHTKTDAGGRQTVTYTYVSPK